MEKIDAGNARPEFLAEQGKSRRNIAGLSKLERRNRRKFPSKN